MIRYVLASASPRRLELMEQLGIYFEVSPAHGEEKTTKELPEDIVEELSCAKACEAADRYADTIVFHANENMGKPKDKNDAAAMLAKLQNDVHQVYTGVTLVIMEKGERRNVTFHEKTDVTMYPMTDAQIQAYVATGEPMDKAGAYAIQGKCAIYIKKIDGEYNNVVGLPVARLMQELCALGLA